MGNKVALITRKMALLGSNMGSMRSIHSAASSGGISRVSQESHKKSKLSLYDKISRNLSFFDTTSGHSLGGGGGRTRRKSRQRSVSDVIKPQFFELSIVTAAAVNEAFDPHDDDGHSSVGVSEGRFHHQYIQFSSDHSSVRTSSVQFGPPQF